MNEIYSKQVNKVETSRSAISFIYVETGDWYALMTAHLLDER